MRMNARPGIAAHFFSVILTYVLILLLVLSVLSGIFTLYIGSDGILRWAILGDGAFSTDLVPAQMEMIREKIDTLAELYHFDPAPVAERITKEQILQQNEDNIAWLINLFGKNRVNAAPGFNGDFVYDLVMEDPSFRSESGNMAAAYARRIRKGVCNAVDQTLLPMRSQLISFALNMGEDKIDLDRIMALLPYIPLMTFVMASMVAALIMLLCSKLSAKGCLYIGSGSGAAGLLLLAMAIGCLVMDIPARCGEIAPIASALLSSLLAPVYLLILASAFVLLLLAFLLIRSHQSVMCRIRKAGREEIPV